MTTTRRAAVYLRVSTDRQTAENQLAEVQQPATVRGFSPVLYEEVESAAKARPVYERRWPMSALVASMPWRGARGFTAP